MTGLLAIMTVVAASLTAPAADDSSVRLKALFEKYWEMELRRDPLNATFLGDHRFDGLLPDPSVAFRAVVIASHTATRDALRALDVKGLTPEEKLDREVLLFQLDDLLEGEKYKDYLIPITQQEGIHLSFAQAVNFHPTAKVNDFLTYIARLRGFPDTVDKTIAVMRQGIAEKRVPPRVTMAKVLPQLRELATARPEDSPHYAIVARITRAIEEDQGPLWPDLIKRQVKEAIAGSVTPAYTKLADFIEREYLPACRTDVGLWSAPDGAEHYKWRARSFTTTTLTPDEIHDLGLREMAKIREGMDAIRVKVGFKGDLKAFLAYIRTDPRFRNRDEAEILARYAAIRRDIDAALPKLFGKLPKARYELKAIEAYRAKAAAAGYYYPSPEDGSRPGYFYVNTSDASSRTTYSMQALAYHESVPGHHLQFAIGLEMKDRPPFRKNGYVPAFSEGWGLYSEALPEEVGLYTDPYALYGRLEYNAWRCARLVVDTGMHAKKWTRAQAIAYLAENTAVPAIEIESEIDRYIAWPGQALAYKVGELKIREIRAKVAARQGEKFDLKAFHDRLLSQGSIPLGVLEAWMTGSLAEKN